VIDDQEAVAEYFHIDAQLKVAQRDFRQLVHKPEHCMQYLQPGRLVRIEDAGTDWGWGVVINFHKKKEAKDEQYAKKGRGEETKPDAQPFIIDVLLNCKVTDSAVDAEAVAKPEPFVEAEAGGESSAGEGEKKAKRSKSEGGVDQVRRVEERETHRREASLLFKVFAFPSRSAFQPCKREEIPLGIEQTPPHSWKHFLCLG
jgi:hypothetical protein